jgi:hypothetical protein
MVNNSTNINNDIPHQIIEHRKVPDHMTLEIQVLTWYMHTYVAIVNVLNLCRKKISPSTNAAYILIENTKTGIFESL